MPPRHPSLVARARKVEDFETFLSQGASPARARREAGVCIADVDAVLGRGAYRRAGRAYASHRSGKAMYVLRQDGWHPARVYRHEDRVLLARYANALKRADQDPRALDPFEGKTITTSLGRVKLVTTRRTLAVLDRKDQIRGQIDRLYIS